MDIGDDRDVEFLGDILKHIESLLIPYSLERIEARTVSLPVRTFENERDIESFGDFHQFPGNFKRRLLIFDDARACEEKETVRLDIPKKRVIA